MILAVAVVAVAVLQRSGPDPFSGAYWDPGRGRRIEITHEGGKYMLLYGVARHGYQAERHGDELQVRDPFSGYVVIRSTEQGLVLVSGARTTKLEPLRPGQ